MSSFFLMKGAKFYISTVLETATGNCLTVDVGRYVTEKGIYIPIGADAIFGMMKFKDPDLNIDNYPIEMARGILIKPNGAICYVFLIPKHSNMKGRTTVLTIEEIIATIPRDNNVIYRCATPTQSEQMGALIQTIEDPIEIIRKFKEVTTLKIPGVHEVSVFDAIRDYNDSSIDMKQELKVGQPMIESIVHDLTRPKYLRLTEESVLASEIPVSQPRRSKRS